MRMTWVRSQLKSSGFFQFFPLGYMSLEKSTRLNGAQAFPKKYEKIILATPSMGEHILSTRFWNKEAFICQALLQMKRWKTIFLKYLKFYSK